MTQLRKEREKQLNRKKGEEAKGQAVIKLSRALPLDGKVELGEKKGSHICNNPCHDKQHSKLFIYYLNYVTEIFTNM